MTDRSQQGASVDEPFFGEPENPLSWQVLGSSFLGGAVGLVAMAPVLVGVPMILGVFEVEPLGRLSEFVISSRDPLLGIAFFVAGGVVVLPLFFIITSTYLPPQEPRYLRGATIASFFWVSFVFVFWPSGSLVAKATFLGVSLVGHWIYGSALGLVVQRLTGIPEHDV